MNGPGMAILLVLVIAASFSSGWVLRDAQAEPFPSRSDRISHHFMLIRVRSQTPLSFLVKPKFSL